MIDNNEKCRNWNVETLFLDLFIHLYQIKKYTAKNTAN